MKARQSEKAKRLLADPMGRQQLREFAVGRHVIEGAAQPAQTIRVDLGADQGTLKVHPRIVPYRGS